MWAIIGGSGFENFDGFETVEELERSTPFGECSSGLRRVKIQGSDAIFISRHGSRHELLPSEVNYRANIYALKNAGVTKILSVSAVGSLREEFEPGDLVITNQYIDRTKSIRKNTFCGEGIVGHVSLAYPVQQNLVEYVGGIKDQFDFNIHLSKTHVVIEGPTFSTRAESLMYRQLGADIIGMTNYPEFALSREAGICYLPLSFVTDYDCWKDDAAHVTVQEVIAVMKANNAKAYQIVSHIVGDCSLYPHGCSDGGLKTGLLSPLDGLSLEQKKWFDILAR